MVRLEDLFVTPYKNYYMIRPFDFYKVIGFSYRMIISNFGGKIVSLSSL